MNVTFSQEPISMQCGDILGTVPSDATCGPLLAPPTFVPNRGICGAFR